MNSKTEIKTFFFCGVGGSGMSSLALFINKLGHKTFGSDRSYDNGFMPEKFDALKKEGIELFPQDGSAISKNIDFLVVSSAVEETIADVKSARINNIPIIKRAELLAEYFNSMQGVAVGGTSGKSTTTAMVDCVLRYSFKKPFCVNGAPMRHISSANTANVAYGDKKDNLCVIEADESDGSIELYSPAISVLNNITLDHKPIAELRPLFTDFLKKATLGAVVNIDDNEAEKLQNINNNTVSYSLKNNQADIVAKNIKFYNSYSTFTINDVEFRLNVAGKHNISNALAAVSVARLFDVPLQNISSALAKFKGVARRLEVVSAPNSDITIIDDFAHNPDKISASLATLQKGKHGKLIIFFQPQGFGPMEMMRKEITESFAHGMSEDDILILPEIFYAGGSVKRTISSKDLVEDVKKLAKQAFFFDNRKDAVPFIKQKLKKGDILAVMGARDDTLTSYAKSFI